MPFQYFNQHRDEDAVIKHLSKFQDVLTEQQKKSIVCSLFHLANGDKEYHNKEHEFILQAAELLGYKLAESEYRIAEELLNMDKDYVFAQLDSLNAEQKDWYAITALGMIHSDGKALEEEFVMLQGFLEKIGISQAQFDQIVQETKLF